MPPGGKTPQKKTRTTSQGHGSKRDNTHSSTLARGLRKLRRERSLSLQEVAEATSISASFLSLVENGKSDITIGRLVRLVTFYGVTLTDLIPPVSHENEPEVTRINERRLVSSSEEGLNVFLLTPDTNRTMMPMVLEFQPGAQLAEFGHHDEGEEWTYVVQGRLCLTLEGADPRYLDAGESAYYPATRPHLFRNDSSTHPLRVICVNTPPV